MTTTGFRWTQIVRLGLVQAAIGAMVMMPTSLLNRVMVVEMGLAAAIPAGLVAWHYAVQLSRPVWGHGSDSGRMRTPWIVGGLGTLAIGSLLAVDAAALLDYTYWGGLALAVFAFALIGAGVGAGGTSLLALIATGVAPERRAAAAATTWILMVVGIILSAVVAGKLLDPFSVQRLALVSGGVVCAAFLIGLVAVRGIEAKMTRVVVKTAAPVDLRTALGELFADRDARRFTVFIFLSMLAYSMQDLILEPFAGLVFSMTPGESTSLSGMQHSGVLFGMILAGFAGSAFLGAKAAQLERWTIAGCAGSTLALLGMAAAAMYGPGWPLKLNVVLLGFANGVFAVSAIGLMMALAGANGGGREGVRMGVWGAAQAIAFGTGGLLGALGIDALRSLTGATDTAFEIVFVVEAVLFLGAATLAVRPVLAIRKSVEAA
jgi:BCD family chlorophyll transporter-like MFS transporter